MYLPNFKSVALPVPELIGGSQKIGAVPDYTHTVYPPHPPPKKKNHICLPYRLSMCTRFPAIFDSSFEWGLRTPKLGEGEAVRGQG